MKKLFLSLAALVGMCASVNAEPIVDLDQNYEGMEEFPYYQMGYAPEVKDGNLVVTNDEAKGNWEVQYFVCYDFDVVADAEYTVTARIKSDVAGDITVVMGNWSEDRPTANMHVEGNNEWAEYSAIVGKVPTGEKNQSFLIFQSGSMVGTYEIEWVKVTHQTLDEPVTPPAVDPYEPTGDEVYYIDYSKESKFPFYVMGYEPAIENGVLVANNPLNENGDPAWYQFFIADFIPTEVGKAYNATIMMKASEEGGANLNMGWGWGEGEQASSSINYPTEWTEVKAIFFNIGGESSNLILQPGVYMGTIEIAWVAVRIDTSTGVETLEPVVNDNTNVYNMMGVKVSDSLEGVAPGLYIVNGKKVIVRK